MEHDKSCETTNKLDSKYLELGSENRMSGARFIAETFKGYGVTHVFFMEIALVKALAEMEFLGIKRVLAHSEKAAAYMADGYARAGLRPGVCMAQSVGAANLAAGLQDPYLARSPVIALTGRMHSLARYRNAYQEIAHGPLFEPVTKYNVSVETVEQLPYLLRQAFREATSGRPGPVHLDLMGNHGQIIAQAETELSIAVEKPFAHVPSNRPVPEPECLQETARLLTEAERPVIVAGGGAKTSSAGSEIVQLAEMLSIPVATSLNGKGIILDDHPLSVGIVGTYACWCANHVVSEADIVLFIGSNTGDLVTNAWKVPKPGTPVIQIDIDPSELGRNYPNTVSLMGDAKVSVRKLIELVKPIKKRTQWSKRAHQFVEEWRSEAEPLWKSDAVPIRPERLCKELSSVLPPNAILVSDTGYASAWTGTMVALKYPGQRYIRCSGSLGWGFPASLGVKCAEPERPVICFTGDGGFWYHMSELETASRCGINTVTVVNNNRGLVQCLATINPIYGDEQGKKDEIWKYQDVNFAKIAQEMGCFGIRVEQPDEIFEAIKMGLSKDVPAVIEVITDMDCKPLKAWRA